MKMIRLKRYRWFILFAFVGLLLAVVSYFYTGDKTNEKPEKPAVFVDVDRVHMKTMQENLHTVGILKTEQSIELSAQDSGYVKKINYNSGEYVKEGSVLVEFDDIKAKTQWMSSQAALTLAKGKYGRAKKLLKLHDISLQDMDQLTADLEQKKALERQAYDTFQKKKIIAPFSGYLGDLQVSIGEFIPSGKKIVELIDRNDLYVSYTVPERYWQAIHLGQPVEVRTKISSDQAFKAMVNFIAPKIDTQTHTVTLHAKLKNTKNLLAPGLFVTIDQSLKDNYQAMMIPEQSILPSLEGPRIFKVENGKAIETPVRLGSRQKGEVEILAGLQVSDMIIVRGQHKVKNGDRVVYAQSKEGKLAHG